MMQPDTDDKAAGFREKLLSRTRQIGVFCTSYGIQNVEVLAHSGFDFMLFDAEHGATSLPALHAQLLAARTGAMASVIRVAEPSLALFKQYLDLGVDGIMLPNVDTAEQAREAVSFMRYPPTGVRGVGGSVRGNHYGRRPLTLPESNHRASLIVQIESARALENLAAIVETDGVDAVFFGPSDLAADLGHFVRPDHPDVVAAVKQGISVVSAKGKSAGVLAAAAQIPEYVAAGVALLASGSDLGLLAGAGDALAQRLRDATEAS